MRLKPKFRKCNPDNVSGQPCVHLGMTGVDSDLRFDKHEPGIQATVSAMKYGLRLLPDSYEGYNPMGHDEALDKEIAVSIDLRSAGFAVWQA